MIEERRDTPRPRILVLSFSPISRDPRVLRQIRLFREFADVVSCGYGETPEGVIEHIEVPASFKSWRVSYKKVASLLAARLHSRLYFHSQRVRFVRDHIAPGSIDVVVANDAIAVPLALALRPRKGVHADLHEYAPKQGEDDRRWRLLVGPLMDWACRNYVTKADSVSTVSKGIAEEYASAYGIPEPSVVPNASAYVDGIKPTPVESPLRLVHTGAAGRVRRIEVMIDAVRLANEMHPGTATLDLVLVPGEQRYIDELTSKAATVPDGAIRMRTAVPFNQIVPMLQEYDVGFYLCPPSNFNMEHALPNKLFEFIQARLAIVIGPSPEMARVTNEYKLGKVADAFDAESAARVLVDLTAEEVAVMKKNADAAAFDLSAEKVTGPWIDAVKTLAAID